MKLQDSINISSDVLKNFSHALNLLFFPLISAIVIFILGLVVATLLQKFWTEVAKLVGFEKSLAKMNNYQLLSKVNKSATVTEVVSSIIWWGTVLATLVTAVEVLGIKEVNTVFNSYFNLLPTFITASAFLLVGALVASFANLLIGIVGSLANFPMFSWVGRFIAVAIMIFSVIFALQTLKVSSEMLRFAEIAFIASVALAFSLAGKELATDIIKKVRDLVK